MTDVVAISASEARMVTDRIKAGVEAVWHLIEQAYTSRAWAVLGYTSWDDYCTREFGTSRIKLPREDRAEVLSSMRELGMSIPAISAATGMSVGSVHSNLSELKGAGRLVDPDEITGTNGKAYAPKPQPKPEPAPEMDDRFISQDELDEPHAPSKHEKPEANTPRRRPITDAFNSATYELKRATEKVERLMADDRIERNKGQIADANLSDLTRVRDALDGVINTLEG